MEEEKINFSFVPKEQQKSDYDWANITCGDERAGKVRCTIAEDYIIIYSINVFQEFEGKGIGKHFVEMCKQRFKTIIADRVRFTAIGFWEKLGFTPDNTGNWVYNKEG